MKKKNKNEITITRVNEEGGWLSCMSAYLVQYIGIMFRTCEALFQYCRFEGHPQVQSEILNCPSPMGVKMIARRERALLQRDGIWDYAESDRELMKQCLRLKLEQHADLQQKLIETGDAVIIEDCTSHDREAARIWGAVRVDGNWVGQNILGQLWMELRSELESTNNETK
jgi:N-glycosidase YbiA